MKSYKGRKPTAWITALILVIIIGFSLLSSSAYDQRPVAPLPVAEVPELSTVVYDQLRELSAETPEVTAEAKVYEPEEKYIILFAKMMYGEGRGVKSDTEVSAIAWTPLNRYDNPSPYDWPHDIEGIITQGGAFEAYSPDNPVTDRLYSIAKDVLIRWMMEQDGVEDVGRVLPSEYTYFSSDGHGRNVFRNAYRSKDADKWDWSLPSPYES
jgi:hypothetical protein